MSLISVDQNASNNQVSFQSVQEAFRLLTQKSDTLIEDLREPVICKLNDIENLSQRILQIAKTYQLHSTGFNIHVSYSDNSSSLFNSIQQFKLKAGTNNSAINSIVLEYNFLILHEETKTQNKYNVNFRIHSGASILKKMDLDGIPVVFKNFLPSNCQTKIEYVDYMIAQNFQNTIKSWHQGLNKYDRYNQFAIKYLQKYSHYLSGVLRFVFYILFLYVVYNIESIYVNFNSLKSVFNFTLNIIIAFFVFRSIFSFLGDKAENSLDNISSASFIIITSGDEKLYIDIDKNNNSKLIWFLFYIVLPLVIGVVSSLIATKIGG